MELWPYVESSSQNFIELWPYAESSSQNGSFSIPAKDSRKIDIDIFP